MKVVYVEAPFKLTPAQVNVLKSKFEKKYKSKIEIKHILSKDLIAGIKIKIDDEVRDFSAKNHLSQLEDQLIC